MFLKTFLKI